MKIDSEKTLLLDGDTNLPDVTGYFHITVDGVPVCLVDRALIGASSSECEHSSLNRSFEECMELQKIFPAALIGVFFGKCPNHCSRKAA